MSVEQLETPALVYNPARTVAWMAKQVELGLATVDLSISQYRILGLLGEGSAMSSSLAERLAVRPPSVTSVIDGLVARGLVDRTHSEDDRRRVSLGLTPEGEAVLEAANQAAKGRLEQIAGCLANAKLAARAVDSLSLWHDALVAYRATRDPR
ncbi:MAG: MarR family winged helix-turn-helix transcriptional regulator [Acidimicrobiales bacterium]